MKMITTIVCRKKSGWLGRVVRRRILIDYCVTAACFPANKGIDLFPRYFTHLGPVSGSLVGCQGRTKQLDLLLVSPNDESLDACNQLIRGRRRLCRSKVIDGIVRKDDPVNAWLREDIAIKAGFRALSFVRREQAISADSLIEHTDVEADLSELLRQIIGPSAV